MFGYVSRGEMATIGSSLAIALVGRMRLSGFIAWLFVHLWFVVEFRNCVLVFASSVDDATVPSAPRDLTPVLTEAEPRRIAS